MNKIKSIWNNVSHYGLTENISNIEKGRIILTNQVCFSTSFLIIIFTVLSWKNNILIGNLVQLCSYIMFNAVIFLNYFGKHLIARLLLTLTASLVIFVNASIMGFESGEAMGFMPIFLGTYILYDFKNKWEIAYAFGVPLVFLIVLETTDYSLMKNKPIPANDLYILFWYNYGVSLLICMLIAIYFKRESRKQQEYIIKSETELAKAKEKETENILKESATEIMQKERDLLAVVTSLDDIVFEINEQYVFLNVWTKDESKLFMPKKSFLGKTMKEVFGEEFCVPFQNSIDEVLSSKQSNSLEYPSFINDGKWYEATVNLINSNDGGIRKVSLIIKDITVRKREEKAARDNFELFRLVADSIPVGMIISRVKDGVILYTNDELARMNKMKKEDFVNTTSLKLYKNPEDRARFLELIRQHGTVLNFETVGILGDGTEAPGLLSGTMSTYLGEPVFIGLVLDITELKKAQEEIKQKNQLLADSKHTALKMQMNPHFIFNALNSIQQRILTGEKSEAYQYLAEFSKLIRNILDNSDKLFISLEEEIESLQLYLKLEAMRLGNSFKYIIDIADDIRPDDVDFPSLILQPFVENAIWHGLMHKEGNRFLKVEIKKKESILYCSIIDNGIGREKAAGLKQKAGLGREAKGLILISERLKLLNSVYPGRTDLSFDDLYESDGSPAGTRVNIKIQL
jgi:PAS domain S-box-containing protein